MKKVLPFLLFVVLAPSVTAESTAAPPVSPHSSLSMSLTPNFTIPVGPEGFFGGGISGSQWFGWGCGATISCQYRLPASPLYIGADLGYSWVPFGDWAASGGFDPFEENVIQMSMLQAGLSAGLHLNILPTLGLRFFGSAGYSYNFLSQKAGKGGTPFVCAGAELSWAFIPSLSLTAGAKYRYFLDFYADAAVTLGISYTLLFGGPEAMKLPTQRVAPLKNEPHLKLPSGSEGSGIAMLFPFLTPMAVLQFSNQVSSSIEPYMSLAIDRNLQSAIGIHQALLLLGVTSVSSPLESKTAVDSVKFPLQTLQDGVGDCRDLSILYCSFLQSLQVETAFITTPDHVLLAFALASSEEEARNQFSHAEELVFRDGKVWVPIEVMERGGSFLTAWQAGAKEWRKARKQAHLYPVPAGGNTQEPSDYPRSSNELPPLDQAQVVSGFQEEIERLVDWEIHDQEAARLAAVSMNNGSPKALNALGVLYARYELLDKAEAQFQAAVEKSEYAPALVNLGNLRLRGKLTEEALGFYQKAATAAPHDPAVLLGLARSNHELQNYELVKEEYEELQTRSPQLAEQFSYLGLQRAAEANGVKDIMVWGEEK